MKLIKPAKAIPLPNFSEKLFRLRTNKQKSEMLRRYPHLTIRALEQGLFDWVFHGILLNGHYRCGLVECDWKSDDKKQAEVEEHFEWCRTLKNLEAMIKKANEEEEEEEKPESEEES